MASDRDAEIVRRVRASYDAFNRGDFDAATEYMHPDIEYVPVGDQPPLRGRDQLRAWMEPSAWEEQRIEPIEISILGNRVLARIRSSARGALSGIEMEIEAWIVSVISDDLLVTRLTTFPRHQEAEARQAASMPGP